MSKYPKFAALWAVTLLAAASLPSCTVGLAPAGGCYAGGGYGPRPVLSYTGGDYYGGGGGHYIVCPRCGQRHYGAISRCSRCGMPYGGGGRYGAYDSGAAFFRGGSGYYGNQRGFYPHQSGYDYRSPWGRGPDHNGVQRWGVQWGPSFRPGGEFRKF